jgi:hypothetical protein
VRIPFVGPTNESVSANASSERTVNAYLELDNANPRAPMALIGTPGLALRFTLGDAPVRGVITQGEYSLWVSGNSVYKVTTGYVATLLGTIGTTSGQVGMSSNGTQTLIVDGVSGWIATATTLTEIADVDFPDGVTRAEYQDGYFIVAGDGTQSFYISDLLDGSSWVGTEFASAEGSPDNTIGLISDHRELWLFGGNSAEIWVNTGNADFPFERSGNSFIEVGCASAATVAKLDNSVFWLGQDTRGGPMVYRAQGYTPLRISNHSIERAMQGYSTVSDAHAYTYQLDGHLFYVLIFPTGDATWFYDVSSQRWFEWSWRSPLTNHDHRHRSNCHVFFGGEHLVGDWENGRVYALDAETYTDNGDPISRLRVTQTGADTDSYSRLFFSELIVDMERGVGLATGQGSDPQLMLRYFDFDKNRWSNLKTKSIGGPGVGGRVRFGPLGSGRDRKWEISMSDPVKFVVYGAMARVEKG